ncbi:hypothetical protein MXAN_4282 [Myxococcus xanthus DK 1622]|uniref:Uncharacterized protein n=1 Tax=Myxococcus xanthus (strain DK1622) TaxID=246197 RepID=Q1D4G6_MYXXD|nr:hypothetical protein MXAN_4282 [Myxococcus xanthus DK 1622]
MNKPHPSNVTHPIFAFLRDHATFEQMREFTCWSTPRSTWSTPTRAMRPSGTKHSGS